MAAWGVVAVCGIGGGAVGPFLDVAARRASARAAAAADDALAIEPPAMPARRSELVGICTLGAAAGALAALRVGLHPPLAAYGLLFAALVALSDADLRTGLVPRRLLYPAALVVGAALVAASAASGEWHRLEGAAAGGAGAFGVFAAVWWLWPKGLGFGDVRLAALCGGALGWLGFAPLYLGFLAAFVAGAVMGVVSLLRAGRRRFPFAPALALGTALGVLWGGWLGNLWLHPR